MDMLWFLVGGSSLGSASVAKEAGTTRCGAYLRQLI